MSEKGGISLFRLLGRGIWFLVRVIILLATNTWIGPKDEEPGKKSALPGTFTPRSTPGASPRSLKTADVVENAERLLRRAERVQALALQATAGDGMVRWLDDALIAPLRDKRRRAKAGESRALLELSRLVPAYESTLAFLARTLHERGEPRRAQLFADVEEVAHALAASLRELDGDGSVRVRQRRFVASAQASAHEVEALRAAGLVAPIVVSPAMASDPRSWPLLAGQVARDLLHDVAGWLDELRIMLGAPLQPRLRLLPSAANAPHQVDEALLGPWLNELMADVLATYMLGPSYAVAFCGQWSAAEVQASSAEADGRWLSPTPPARLRIHAVLSTLEELGFESEASALRAQSGLIRVVAAPLQIPALDGSHYAVPFEGVAEALDAQISLALQEPNLALGQRSWLDVLGLAFLHGEQAEANSARGRLARGEKVALPTRVLVASAAQALAVRGVAQETVLSALLRSIRGVDVLEAAQAVLPAVRRSAGTKTRLHDLATDPRAISDALVLGAVFSPPKALNRALSKR